MYYCKNCGEQYQTDEAVICLKCGVGRGLGSYYCHHCGKPLQPQAAVCMNCGVAAVPAVAAPGAKSKVLAGVLGIFFGAFGVHNFYLGYTTKAVIQLVCTIVGLVLSCVGIGILLVLGMSIWGLVEGILLLVGKINTDGKGLPLAD